jgi:hypothetical protein
VPNQEEWLHIGTFLLGFLTLTLSWYGYHGSLQKRPHKYESGKDMARFVLDVVLVILYGLMLIRFKSLTVVLVILAIVFIIYTFWDAIKFATPHFFEDEDGKEDLELKRRTAVTFGWTIALLAVVGLHCIFGFPWLSLGLATACTVLYRWNKYSPLRDLPQKLTQFAQRIWKGTNIPT